MWYFDLLLFTKTHIVPVVNIESGESLPTEEDMEDDPDGELMENLQTQQQGSLY
jgi:hypothetical protein